MTLDFIMVMPRLWFAFMLVYIASHRILVSGQPWVPKYMGNIYRELPFCQDIGGQSSCAVYGGTFNLTCEINDLYTGKSNASHIFFQYQSGSLPKQTYPEKFTRVLSNTTAQLIVPDMPHFDLIDPEYGRCHHFCMIKEGEKMTELVKSLTVVGRLPPQPHSIECQWINWANLECNWQPSSFKSKAVFMDIKASLKTCPSCDVSQVVNLRYPSDDDVDRCIFTINTSATYFHVEVNISNPFDKVGKSAYISGDLHTLSNRL
ncbi:unnamed protein product [Owenia fusiformis]|uniref:Uncharacterized protein n=1 Tax=Owenia fusiformis TaxID=6347 RepID=A0A8J1UCX3_OWEFU|nr:unnamed protein product [Owenia fusiformis]